MDNPQTAAEKYRQVASAVQRKTGWRDSVPVHGDSIADDFEYAANWLRAAADEIERLEARK